MYEYLNCFHLLAVVNNTDRNMDLQISLHDPAISSFAYIYTSGIAGSYSCWFLIFLRKHHSVSIAAVPFYYSFPSAVYNCTLMMLGKLVLIYHFYFMTIIDFYA